MRNKWLTLILVAFAVVVLLAPAAGAQTPQSTEETPITISDEDATAMGLSGDARDQVKSINQTRNDQIKAVAQDNSLTGAQKSARIREINKSSNAQINGLLTPQQRATYHRRRADRREDVRDRREDRRDAKHDGGVRDEREDVRDRKEDRRDRKEDVRDRKEDRRDAKNGVKPPPKKRS